MSWRNPALAAIAASLTRSTGLTFPPERIGFAELGIRRAMTALRETDPLSFLQRVEHDPAARQAAIAEVTVAETYFFRDQAQLDVLRARLVPELLARKSGRALQVWSAGCASGEEAYSLAMLLEECGAADAAVVGTDLCAAAIAAATAAVYGRRSFRDDTAAWRERYFSAVPKGWAIDARFRRRVTFAVHNVLDAADSAFGERSFDLILCRNVMIYFDEAAVTRAAATFVARLAPGGWLVTSPTDPMLRDDLLETVSTPAGIAYRRRALAAVPALPHAPLALVPRLPLPLAEPRRPAALRVAPLRALDEGSRHLAEALRLLEIGDPREALAAARRARYVNPSSPLVHLTLARAYRRCGRTDLARRALLRGRALLGMRTAPDIAMMEPS